MIAVALACGWNLSPLAWGLIRSTSDPSASAAYWQPAVNFLHGVLTPAYRVEAVDTTGHWAAVYLARAGIPIVRGWFRQDDFPQNEVLYDGLGPHSYLYWLHSLGVRYVVLTDAPADYSARAEAALLRSGGSGLQVVYTARNVIVYAVPHPTPIVTGPPGARVVALHQTEIDLQLREPGSYRISVRYSPYFAARGACITKAKDGMTLLNVSRAGRVRFAFAVTPGRALAALAGRQQLLPSIGIGRLQRVET